MTTKKKIGVWMDHANAHLMEYADPINSQTIESAFTHDEKERTLQNGETMMHNKEQQLDAAYYKKITEAIKGYDEVLLFGPTRAKTELLNRLKEDMHFNNIHIEVKQTDKMTENQEHAFVRDYFSSGNHQQ